MVLKEELTEALKDRIERDLHATLFDGWDKVALGKYYFSADSRTAEIVVERVVGEVLDNVLKAHGRMIGRDSWEDFFSGIDPTTTPADAIGKMLDAAGTSVFIPHSTPLFLDPQNARGNVPQAEAIAKKPKRKASKKGRKLS